MMMSIERVPNSTPFAGNRFPGGFSVQLDVHLGMSSIDLRSALLYSHNLQCISQWPRASTPLESCGSDILRCSNGSVMISLFDWYNTLWVGSVSLHPFFNNSSLWSAYLAGGTLMRSLRLKGTIDLISKLLTILRDWFIICCFLCVRSCLVNIYL